MNFQSLADVRGALYLNSTRDMSCDRFDEYESRGIVKGTVDCITASDRSSSGDSGANGNSTASAGDNSTSSHGAGSNTSSSGLGDGGAVDGQSQSLSTGAKAGIGIGVVAGVGAICGLLFWLWFRRRAQARKKASETAGDAMSEKDGAEVDAAHLLSNDAQKHEMEQPPGEVGTGREGHEMPAKHGDSELDRSASTKAPEGIESRHEMSADQTLR